MTPRRQRSQALTEFALVLPIFVVFVMVIIQLSLVFITYYSETRMTRETARWLAVHATTTDDDALAAHVQGTMLPGLVNGAPSVTFGTDTTPAVATVGQMTVTYTPCEWGGGPNCHYPTNGTPPRTSYQNGYAAPAQGTPRDGRGSGQMLFVTMSYNAANLFFLPTTWHFGWLVVKLPTTLPPYTVWVMVE
jgi:hypothetical protein